MSVVPRIKRILVECLDLDLAPEELPDYLSLADRKTGGIDSVEAVAVVIGVEQEFGIRFTEDELDLELLISLPRIVELVERKLAQG